MTSKANTSHSPTAAAGGNVSLSAEIAVAGAVCLDNAIVSGGLCVPKGVLLDAAVLYVQGLTRTVIAQAEVLNRWSDGSVRWMLVSFVIPPTAPDLTTLRLTEISPPATSPAWTAATAGVRIPLTLTTQPAAANVVPLSESREHTVVRFTENAIRISVQSLCESDPFLRTLRIAPELTRPDGTTEQVRVDSIRREVDGPVRQVFVISTHLTHHKEITLQFRITNWIAARTMLLETRIRNTRRAQHRGGLWDLGDVGSFLFSELQVEISDDEITESSKATLRSGRTHSPLETDGADVLSIQQFGSGGPAWASTSHVTASGSTSVTKNGYEVRCGSRTWTGDRAEPVVVLTGADASLAVAVPEFWQKFPGRLATSNGRISVGLFPAAESEPYELQGGEQSTKQIWITATHANGRSHHLEHVFSPPQLLQSAEVYRNADVFAWFPGGSGSSADAVVSGKHEVTGQHQSPDDTSAPRTGSGANPDDVRRLFRYLAEATTGRHAIPARRETIDEYGWRNFGDVPADHEQTHFAGTATIVSHYNNQFDLVLGGILQLAATGDLRWRELFDPLARHVCDIDVYHTNRDRAAFNGGLFWHTDHYVDARTASHRTYSRQNQQPGQVYGGGPSCEHNYTTGLMYYYFLTGNPEARETVLSLAEWVIRMDDGSRTVFGLLDDGPTGLASATVFEDFHGPGRGAGNSLNAMLDAWQLTRSERFLRKAEELIRRCVHPQQNPDELHLLDAEGHWSYTVFLTSLSRYLLIRQEADDWQQDAMYTYAREVMQTFGRWMAVHERPTLSQPDKLQYPTEAWAAQDFRKANVLHLAAACEDDAEQAAAMRDKARQLNNVAWHDLYRFREAHRTARCLSILMTEGQRDVFHRTCPPTVISPGSVPSPQSQWKMFVPQRTRVKALLKSPVRLMLASVQILNPRRVQRAIQALVRQL